jgi:hypothetical protein
VRPSVGSVVGIMVGILKAILVEGLGGDVTIYIEEYSTFNKEHGSQANNSKKKNFNYSF